MFAVKGLLPGLIYHLRICHHTSKQILTGPLSRAMVRCVCMWAWCLLYCSSCDPVTVNEGHSTYDSQHFRASTILGLYCTVYTVWIGSLSTREIINVINQNKAFNTWLHSVLLSSGPCSGSESVLFTLGVQIHRNKSALAPNADYYHTTLTAHRWKLVIENMTAKKSVGGLIDTVDVPVSIL